MEELRATQLVTLVSSHHERGQLAKITARWAQQEHEKALKLGNRFYPGSCVIRVISDLANRSELDCVLGIIDGLGSAARAGVPQCATIGRTLGYSLGCDRGKNRNTVFGQAKSVGRDGELLNACMSLNGMVTISQMVARSSSDLSMWIPFLEPPPANQSCGALMARDVLDQYPELSFEVEIEELFGRIPSWLLTQSTAPDPRAHHVTRLAIDGLCAWLDSPPKRRYRGHLESGPKGLATSVTTGLVALHAANLLDENDTMSLMSGKRAGRLDKTLGRGARLCTNKGPGTEAVELLRAYLRMRGLTQQTHANTDNVSAQRNRL